MRCARACLRLCLLGPLVGCTSDHGALHPGGPRAESIANLLLLFCAVSAVVYLIVIGFLMWSLFRRRAREQQQGEESRSARPAWRLISIGVALTVAVLVTLAVADFAVERGLSAHPADAMRIVLTGHQYWWEVEYESSEPSQRLHTANEIHIPVNRPVEFVLTSRDVIHSFWLPSLMGKKDLIPGYTNTEVVIAARPGTFTGQCAEFCGLQHAQMRLTLRAETPQDFERWRQQQLAEATVPASDSERRGQEVFLRSSCILCHTIQGTDAGATVGPDLTHLASRRTLAAGTLLNTPANLASWILQPQRLKPGAMMPATALPPDDLAALTTYLGSLR
jgi:cytochrome c oxidase subunit II